MGQLSVTPAVPSSTWITELCLKLSRNLGSWNFTTFSFPAAGRVLKSL